MSLAYETKIVKGYTLVKEAHFGSSEIEIEDHKIGIFDSPE